MKNENIVKSVMLGAFMVVMYVVIATIVGELYKPYKNFLTDLHYHHWVGKGVWAIVIFIIVFAVSYLTTKNKNNINSTKMISALSYMLGVGTIILTLFFTYEYIIHH